MLHRWPTTICGPRERCYEGSWRRLVKFFGTCWDWKSDAPIGEIGDRVNDLLRIGAREIGLHLADGGAADTYCLIICDQRELEQAFVEELWDEWWKTHISDDPEDVPFRRPNDAPMTWPLTD